MASVTYAAFKRIVEDSLNRFFEFISQSMQSGQITAPPGYSFLFPTTLVFTNTNSHYVFELLGVRQNFKKLTVKSSSKKEHFNRTVSGFDSDQSTAYIFGTGDSSPTNIKCIFRELNLGSAVHLGELDRRFPGFSQIYTPHENYQLVSFLNVDSFMPIDAQCFPVFALDRCILTSNVGKAVRAKFADFLFGVSIGAERDYLARELDNFFRPEHGCPLSGIQMTPATKRNEAIHLAAGFVNLYFKNVRETTLTSFLEEHGEILQRAFGASQVFYQPKLPWRERNSDPNEVFIQPDVILRRSDGSWAIVEFKLPLLERSDLTRGGHRRRRFIEPVYEGISQLANYEDYFKSPANGQATREVMGESPVDPQLILVVGTLENADLRKIEEAKRAHGEVDVIDYDSLVRVFIGNVPT